MRHTMHLRPGVAKQPNLELKTQPKQLLGALPLVITLPGWVPQKAHYAESRYGECRGAHFTHEIYSRRMI
jgi:hypothetical protein